MLQVSGFKFLVLSSEFLVLSSLLPRSGVLLIAYGLQLAVVLLSAFTFQLAACGLPFPLCLLPSARPLNASKA